LQDQAVRLRPADSLGGVGGGRWWGGVGGARCGGRFERAMRYGPDGWSRAISKTCISHRVRGAEFTFRVPQRPNVQLPKAPSRRVHVCSTPPQNVHLVPRRAAKCTFWVPHTQNVLFPGSKCPRCTFGQRTRVGSCAAEGY